MRRQCDSVRDGDLVAYLADPDDATLSGVHAHVSDCEECTNELRAWRALRGDLLIDDDAPWGDHPAEENLIAFGENAAAMRPALSTEIEAHLSGCAVCRDEMRVLAGVRIEPAVAEESIREDRGVTQPVREMPIDSIVDSIADPAVIASMTLGRRLRHPGVAFALFVVLSLPVLGLLAIESGRMPVGEDVELRPSAESEFDRHTFTARHTSVTDERETRKSDLRSLEAPVEETAARTVIEGLAPAPAAEKLRRQVAAEPRPLAATPAPSLAPAAAGGHVFADKLEEAAEAAESIEGIAEFEDFEAAPSASEDILSPEQLIAMMETERRVAEMRERALEIPDPIDTTPSGAAIVETMPSSDPHDATERDATDDEISGRSRMVAPESMILGVRSLGRAPLRGEMVSMSGSTDRASGGAPGGDSAAALRGGGRGKARVHFVRGSSYVFTRDEVYQGLEIRFPLPMRDGEVRSVDVRLLELGTDRVITQAFAAPDPPVQSSPLVSLDVPAGWLSAGRYSVELTTRKAAQEVGQDAAQEAEADSAVSINIRVLDSSARQAPPDRPAAPASNPLE